MSFFNRFIEAIIDILKISHIKVYNLVSLEIQIHTHTHTHTYTYTYRGRERERETEREIHDANTTNEVINISNTFERFPT